MPEKFKIMIVEDEALPGKIISSTLEKHGYAVTLFGLAEEALVHFNSEPVDLVLLDCKLPGMKGEELFEQIRKRNPLLPVIFMTAYSSVEKAVQLLKKGAYTYLIKPIEMDKLLHDIGLALEKVSLLAENRRLQEDLQEKFSFGRYVFSSEKMQQVMSIVMRAAGSSSNILISGESGTGKEVVANIIHHYSSRCRQKLVKVNLAAIPETLVESELFGSVRGAFTGAVENRTGRFAEADGGTIFLDEIGELPPETQVKLLRVIQEREVTKLGTNKPSKIDIRLITASNKDLAGLVKENKFREDLYFRLNVINIELPPLRDRREEIKLLADLFIKKVNLRENKNIRGLTKDALNALIKYDYPGNIRELENVIERAVILSRSDILSLADLPLHLTGLAENADHSLLHDNTLPLPERMNLLEKSIIVNSLAKNKFNQSKTALELGLSESGLRYKIQQLHIKKH